MWAELTSPESLKTAIPQGQMALHPLVPSVGSRRGGNPRHILSFPSVNRNTENLCICLSSCLWWELGYTPEMLRSKQCLRNSSILQLLAKKKLCTPAKRSTWAGHLPPGRRGAQGGLGSTALAGPSHRDQPTLTTVHGISSVQKACYREVIQQNLSTGSFLQEKQFLPAFVSVTLSQQLMGWNQGIAGGFHSGLRASTHQSSSFVNCSYGG